MGQRFSALAAIAVLAIGAAACGGAKAGGVASLGGTTTTTTSARQASSNANAKEQFRDAMLDYARCMREHGVDMPDPTFDDSGAGGGNFKVVGGAPGNAKDDASFEAAQKACQPIMDKAEQDMPRPSPEEEAKMRDQALAMARCMREHGVDMPDPTFDDSGRASIQLKKPAGDDKSDSASGGGGVKVSPIDDPKFKAAMEACQPAGGKGGFATSEDR